MHQRYYDLMDPCYLGQHALVGYYFQLFSDLDDIVPLTFRQT